MRVYVYTSSWAKWSSRLAQPVIPLAVIAVALHYVGYVQGQVFVSLVQVAIAFGLLAMCVAIVACVRMWNDGTAGWGRAFHGLLSGLVAIAILSYVGLLDARFPRMADVSTTGQTLQLWPGRIGQETTPQPVEGDRFPGVETRQYPISLQSADEMISRIASRSGWTPRGTNRPSLEGMLYYFEIKTPLGFVDDVTLQVRGTDNNVVVDMRSASRFGQADLGRNGHRILTFLRALDEQVAKLTESSQGRRLLR